MEELAGVGDGEGLALHLGSDKECLHLEKPEIGSFLSIEGWWFGELKMGLDVALGLEKSLAKTLENGLELFIELGWSLGHGFRGVEGKKRNSLLTIVRRVRQQEKDQTKLRLSWFKPSLQVLFKGF